MAVGVREVWPTAHVIVCFSRRLKCRLAAGSRPRNEAEHFTPSLKAVRESTSHRDDFFYSAVGVKKRTGFVQYDRGNGR